MSSWPLNVQEQQPHESPWVVMRNAIPGVAPWHAITGDPSAGIASGRTLLAPHPTETPTTVARPKQRSVARHIGVTRRILARDGGGCDTDRARAGARAGPERSGAGSRSGSGP